MRHSDHGVAVVDVPPPSRSLPQIAVTAAGICGSDLHALRMEPSPVTWGHEFGGFIDDGTLVAVQPSVSCRECRYCIRGDEQLCGKARVEFYGWTLDGGLAERVAVQEHCVVRVPPSVDPGTVGLVEPIAVAVHAVNQSGPRPSTRALVIGGGTIGLLCAAVLRERGVDVDMSVRHSHQARVATALGANVGTGSGYPLIVDAAGTPDSIEQAVRAVERGGTIMMVAVPWNTVPLPVGLVLNEIRLLTAIYYGRHGGGREFEEAAQFLATHPEVGELLITHRFKLGDAVRAFAIAGDRAAGAIKVMLSP